MNETSNDNITQETSLLDDLILNENDLTEKAKTLFTYHTDIFNAFDAYRLRVLRDENLSPVSRHKFLFMLSDYHAKGKQVLNYMAENNELLSRSFPPMGPVIICGLPRTGTTLLYNLLACDPHCRAPFYTDMRVDPTPPIARSNSIEQERRNILVKLFRNKYSDKKDDKENNFQISHPRFPIEEDYVILYHAGFIVFQFLMILNNQSKFSDFVSDEMQKDFIYDYHEIFLRMLNSVDTPSSHWLLKAPAHLLYLDTLLQHYPNAAIIMTHRSINETLPSFVCLMSNFEKLHSIETSSPGIREARQKQYTQFFDKLIECLLKFRSRQSEKKKTFDVLYDDLMQEPIHTVRRIYDHFSLKWSDEFEMAMQCWLHDNPQGKQGRHTYSLDDFGLKKEDIDARYVDYINLFLRSSAAGTT